VVVLALVSARGVAFGDGCTDLETWARRLVQEAHAVSARATEGVVKCAFTGADDKFLATLASDAGRRFKQLVANTPQHAVCHDDLFSIQEFSERVLQTTGERLGFVFGLCSSQAREKLRQLAAEGKVSPENTRKVLEPLAQSYMADVFPE
jgi:hypothetical protein